jgi:hypothetical protein
LIEIRKTFHQRNQFVITIRKVARHVISVLCCIAFFAIVPLALYGSWVIPRAVSAADLGGPLNFFIIPFAGALIGLVISVVVFLPLSLVAEHFSFRRWWQTVALSTGVLTVIVVIAAVFAGPTEARVTGWLTLLIPAGLGLYLVGGFFVYLCCIGIGRRMFP